MGKRQVPGQVARGTLRHAGKEHPVPPLGQPERRCEGCAGDEDSGDGAADQPGKLIVQRVGQCQIPTHMSQAH